MTPPILFLRKLGVEKVYPSTPQIPLRQDCSDKFDASDRAEAKRKQEK